HLGSTFVDMFLRRSILGRSVRSRPLMPNVCRLVLSRSLQHSPASLSPGALSLRVPMDVPPAPLVVIGNAGKVSQSGRWQAMDAHWHCRNDALSRLTHEMGASPSVRAELIKCPVRKFHCQGRGGRCDFDHTKFDRTGCEFISEVGKHAVNLRE